MGLLPVDRVISFESLRDLNDTSCKSYNNPSTLAGNGAPSDWKVVLVVVLMAVMSAALYGAAFIQLIFGRNVLYVPLFRGRYNLNTIFRFLLHFAMVQFLPLLSIMASRASNTAADGEKILLVITWMLLIELIRKKVLAMVLPTDGSSFKRSTGRVTLMEYSDEVARLVWIAYLIYSNMKVLLSDRCLMKAKLVMAMFIVLWLLSFLKLVHRVVATWLTGRSWITVKNPILIAGYMQHVHQEEEEKKANHTGSIMESCRYAVMGEDKLVFEERVKNKRFCLNPVAWVALCARRRLGPSVARARPGDWAPATPKNKKGGEDLLKLEILESGYGVGRRLPLPDEPHPHVPRYDQSEQKQLHLLIRRPLDCDQSDLVTLGDIWQSIEKESQSLFWIRREPSKKFAQNLCLSFALFKMLRRRFEHYPMVEVGSDMARRLMFDGLLALGDEDADKARPFEVLQLELELLENYYQADVAPVVMSQPYLFFSSIVMSIIFAVMYLAAVLSILICYNGSVASLGSNPGNFPTLYLFITMLLVVTLVTIEATEFWSSFVLSNWNTVRLLCSYKGRKRNPVFKKAIFWTLLQVRSLAHSLRGLSCTGIRMDQVSIVDACWPLDEFPIAESASFVVLTNDFKELFYSSLKKAISGTIRMPRLDGLDTSGRTCTEVILACHLATQLLEANLGRRCLWKKKQPDDKVAVALSRYCMYLVARAPELLPDNEAWANGRYKDMKNCLRKVWDQPFCAMCTPSRCCRKKLVDKLEEAEENGQLQSQDQATSDGVKIYLQRKGNCKGEHVWEELAEFWVDLVVYLAPSNDVQGHAKALASTGGGLITCLWAFCTHAGITREPIQQHDSTANGIA